MEEKKRPYTFGLFDDDCEDHHVQNSYPSVNVHDGKKEKDKVKIFNSYLISPMFHDMILLSVELFKFHMIRLNVS